MFCNFCRIHKTLRVTPAMAAGVTDQLLSVDDIVAPIELKEKGIFLQRRSGRTQKAPLF
jgi:hypothetical protein